MARNRYLDSVISKLERVREDAAITEGAQLIVDTIRSGKRIYTFGASHAGILSEELFYRAGGLALFNPIFDKNLMLDVRPITKTSNLEQLPNYGKAIGEHVPFQESDLLLAHSVSGRNPVMIDLVQHAKECGVKVVGITNITYSKETKSRHHSGLRLFELADVVIDNHGETGDATISFSGLPQKVAPTSTVIGSAIVNSLLVEVVSLLLASDQDVPIFFSANLDDPQGHNAKIFAKYKEQICYM